MLELLFAAALMDTIIAEPDYGTVHVHEWGAVTFSEENVIFGANPMTDPNSDFIPPDHWDEPVARAPIVYFYGEPFTGTFTVNVHSGNFIETLPVPSSLVSTSPMPPENSYSATWVITGTSNEQHRDITGIEYSCISADLLKIWREPSSYLLDFDTGAQEKFVYYECSLHPSSGDAFYPVLLQNDGAVLDPDYTGPVMRFLKDGDTVNMELITAWTEPEQAINASDQNLDVPEILCDWAGGSMKSEELNSMWDTWKSWIFDGSWSGDTLLVFPLPINTIEGMTSINLAVGSYANVEYSRFYLGIISN